MTNAQPTGQSTVQTTGLSAIAGEPVTAAPASSRYQWMDISRGLGVILIVVVHAGSFFSGMSRTDVPGWLRAMDLALSPYRIPLLIFLSGMLLTRSLAKGSERFTTGKIRNLLWPYLIWTAIIALASGPAALLSVKVWLGGTVLWYLTFLMLFYAIGLLFARVPVLVIAAYALAISMVMPDETKYGSRLFLLMSYFFVGAFAGQHLERFTDAIRSRWILALLPLLVTLSLYATTQVPQFKYSPYVAPLVIAVIVSMCGVFNLFARGAVAAAFRFAGRNSLVYYVAHAPIYLILYNGLFALGITSPYVCIGLGLVLGILVPTSLALLKDRSPAVKLLFEGPEFRVGPAFQRLARTLDQIVLPHRLAPATATAPAPAPAPGALPAGRATFDQTTLSGTSAKP